MVHEQKEISDDTTIDDYLPDRGTKIVDRTCADNIPRPVGAKPSLGPVMRLTTTTIDTAVVPNENCWHNPSRQNETPLTKEEVGYQQYYHFCGCCCCWYLPYVHVSLRPGMSFPSSSSSLWAVRRTHRVTFHGTTNAAAAS